MELELLTVDDLEDAVALSKQVDWNQTRADWRRLLDLHPETCFAGRVDGELVGTSTLATYGDSVGWVGMVLVDDAHRRRGYGSELFARSLEAGSDIAVVGLDATDAGAAVYEGFGFERVSRIDRWTGTLQVERPDAAPAVRSVESADDVLAFDESHCRVRRNRLLRSLISDRETQCFLAGERGDLQGYVIVRPGRTHAHVGPLVATRPAAAVALLAEVGARSTAPVYLDVHRTDRSTDLLEGIGLDVVRELYRMVNRRGPPPLVTDSTVAAVGFEWG